MKLAIVTLILGLFGLIVCILSTALDYWYLYSGEQGNAHFGLWIFCFSTPQGNEVCHTWKSVESLPGSHDASWLHACQAFMILADIFIAFGLVGFGIFILRPQSKLYLKTISMALCIASGLCAIIAVSVFGAKYKKIDVHVYLEQGSLHAGFGLAVCGAVLGLVTGLLIGSHKTAYASI